MNPALPLLVGLGGAGLAAGLAWSREGSLRRELALAFAVTAFAGTALLAPALAIPDGIPSPAATLATVPPWQGTGDAAAGNPLLGDVTFQVQPWLLYLRGELRAGRLPFWNPYQFSGTPFWANGQSAPLFPLHLLFAALPVQLGFVLLPWLRLAVAGGGVWLFARALGLSRPAALVSTLIFPLSGMMVSFLLFPMGNALALVPWVFWAVERLAAGERATAALAVAAGLLLLGGHPETAVHAAMLSAIYLAVRGGVGGRLAAGPWLRFAAGWGLAGALAAVQLLPLAETLPETSRWHHLAETGAAPPLSTLLAQPLRLVLPGLYGHPALGTWWGPFNYSATAVYAGALALPLAAAAASRLRTDRRLLALAAVLAFSFVAAYHLPGVHDLLGALPVIGRMAHHRLIFGIELALALLAGAGCDAWLAGKGKGMAIGSALALVLLAAAFGLFRGEWAARGLLPGQLAWGVGVAAAALLAALSLRAGADLRWRLFPLLPALVLGDLLLAHGRILGALPISQLYPETPAVRFLAGKEGRVAGVGSALRPNAAMVYGLYDVRGDDPVKLERYERVYARAAPGDPVYFRPLERWREPWLDRLGLRWVLAPPGTSQALGEPGWRLAYDGADARVFECPGALPLVRFGDGGSGGSLAVRERAPGHWRLAWETPVRRTAVIAETFDRGWRAAISGNPAKVSAVDGLLLGVEVGPGRGELELSHRPVGFVPGAVASLVALAVLVAMALRLSPPSFQGPKGRQDVAWGASPRKGPHPNPKSPEGATEALHCLPFAPPGLGQKDDSPTQGLRPGLHPVGPPGLFPAALSTRLAPRLETYEGPGRPPSLETSIGANFWRAATGKGRFLGGLKAPRGRERCSLARERQVSERREQASPEGPLGGSGRKPRGRREGLPPRRGCRPGSRGPALRGLAFGRARLPGVVTPGYSVPGPSGLPVASKLAPMPERGEGEALHPEKRRDRGQPTRTAFPSPVSGEGPGERATP